MIRRLLIQPFSWRKLYKVNRRLDGGVFFRAGYPEDELQPSKLIITLLNLEELEKDGIELIKKLWAIAWDLWEHRNRILHKTLNVVTTTELHRLNRRVTDTYTTLRSVLLPAHDRHLISGTLPRLLKKDLVYKEVWLRNALATLNSTHQATCHHYSRTMRGMRRCMKRFLYARLHISRS